MRSCTENCEVSTCTRIIFVVVIVVVIVVLIVLLVQYYISHLKIFPTPLHNTVRDLGALADIVICEVVQRALLPANVLCQVRVDQGVVLPKQSLAF